DIGKSEPRSIYVSYMRAIQQLEQKGLITSRPYHSSGRVMKKIKLQAKVGKLRNRLKKRRLG
ncbi:unnamed protein product, partial [marine sediment metagenome]